MSSRQCEFGVGFRVLSKVACMNPHVTLHMPHKNITAGIYKAEAAHLMSIRHGSTQVVQVTCEFVTF